MSARRRNVAESSETRNQLLDAAEAIMKEEGYPAVTTRRLAGRLGVSNQLVHYYFRTMDDLFLSLMRRGAERSIARLVRALTAKNPLQALVELYSDTDAARLQIEYLALINHRKDLPGEAARYTEHLRSLEAESLSRVLKDRGVDESDYPAKGLAVILSAIGRIIALEKTVGIAFGHTEAIGILERGIASMQQGASVGSDKSNAADKALRKARSKRAKAR